MTGGEADCGEALTGFAKEADLYDVILQYAESACFEIQVEQHGFFLGQTRSSDECLQMHKTVIASMSQWPGEIMTVASYKRGPTRNRATFATPSNAMTLVRKKKVFH